MPDKVYTMVDAVGASEDSIHQAVRNALSRAEQTPAQYRLVRGQEHSRRLTQRTRGVRGRGKNRLQDGGLPIVGRGYHAVEVPAHPHCNGLGCGDFRCRRQSVGSGL